MTFLRPGILRLMSYGTWYRPSDRPLSAKSVTDPYDRILRFLNRSRYFFFQVPPQLYSRGSVDPFPDPLLLRKPGSAGNWTKHLWIYSQEIWPLDYRGCTVRSRTQNTEFFMERDTMNSSRHSQFLAESTKLRAVIYKRRNNHVIFYYLKCSPH
jgi:hypothetical protein